MLDRGEGVMSWRIPSITEIIKRSVEIYTIYNVTLISFERIKLREHSWRRKFEVLHHQTSFTFVWALKRCYWQQEVHIHASHLQSRFPENKINKSINKTLTFFDNFAQTDSSCVYHYSFLQCATKHDYGNFDKYCLISIV